MRDAVAYICKHYPRKDELSNARVTKMVYLADWRSAITRGEQLTDIEWTFSHYGPFVYDVLDAVKDDPALSIESTRNLYGTQKNLLQAANDVSYPSLDKEEKEILDFVIESSSTKNWDKFIKLVYSTWPIATEERYSKLDLVELAREYEEIAQLLDPKK